MGTIRYGSVEIEVTETMHLLSQGSSFMGLSERGGMVALDAKTEAEAVLFLRERGANKVMIQRWVEAP